MTKILNFAFAAMLGFSSVAFADIGTVKWYDPGKGYGFIVPRTGEADVFVRAAELEQSGLTVLFEGQVVEYDLRTFKRNPIAVNIVVLR